MNWSLGTQHLLLGTRDEEILVDVGVARILTKKPKGWLRFVPPATSLFESNCLDMISQNRMKILGRHIDNVLNHLSKIFGLSASDGNFELDH